MSNFLDKENAIRQRVPITLDQPPTNESQSRGNDEDGPDRLINDNRTNMNTVIIDNQERVTNVVPERRIFSSNLASDESSFNDQTTILCPDNDPVEHN